MVLCINLERPSLILGATAHHRATVHRTHRSWSADRFFLSLRLTGGIASFKAAVEGIVIRVTECARRICLILRRTTECDDSEYQKSLKNF